MDQFIRTLREKRAQIMKQLPVKDVRFKLACQNGKAAIRYMTVNRLGTFEGSRVN